MEGSRIRLSRECPVPDRARKGLHRSPRSAQLKPPGGQPPCQDGVNDYVPSPACRSILASK
jgi:hypothetical protein